MLPTLGLKRLTTRIDVCLLGLLLLNRAVDSRWTCQNLSQFRAWLRRFNVFGPEAKNKDLAQWAITSLRRICTLNWFGIVELELPLIRHNSARTSKNAQRTPLQLVIEDRSIPELQLLITSLPFTRVVKTTVWLPIVVIAMLLARSGVVKNEDIWSLCRGTNSPLPLSSEPLMKRLATNFLIGLQIPHCCQSYARQASLF